MMNTNGWGIREVNGRYEVYGPRLQFCAVCKTSLDAETVLLGCLSRYCGLHLSLDELRQRMRMVSEVDEEFE